MKKFFVFIIIFIILIGGSFAAPGVQTGTTLDSKNYQFEFNPNDISDSVALGFTGAGYNQVHTILETKPIGEIKAEVGKLKLPEPNMTFKQMTNDTAQYIARVFFYGKVRSLKPYKISFELTNLQPVDGKGVVISGVQHFKVDYSFSNMRLNLDNELSIPAPEPKKVTVAAGATANSIVDVINAPGIFDGKRTNLNSWFFGKIDISANGVKFPDQGTWSGTVTMKFVVQ